ncbi:hypothetical protein [Pseudooceanicola sp. LIPI14-2-Ac024]|uniref:hypothetical protein n=1 Tax=Pseudooceanicola sp. LIPI14-2-Ac024 TaxID=3344875 RepID=UPI0035CF59BD
MRALYLLAACGGVLFASPALAQGVELSYGAAANLGVSDGDTSFTVEGEVTASYNGFFAGIWAETVDGGTYDLDIELSAGYAFALGTAEIGLTYTAYFTDDDYDTQSIELGVGVPVSDMITLGSAASYDIDNEVWDLSVGFEATPIDKVTIAALIGDDGTGTYWEAGASYALTDSAFVGLLYEDSDYDVETVTFSIGFAF